MSRNLDIFKYFIDCSIADSQLWDKGDYICREDGPMSKLYYLKRGRCRVFRDLSNGQTILYRIYLPGSILGDIELFTGMEASCSVQCITPVETLSVKMELIRNNIEGF
jgi:CRP-like cAMP-binding protein